MLELNKIYCMDAIEFMKQIDYNSVDLILCDLPYGTTTCSWDEIIPFEAMWKEMLRIAKEDCVMVFTGSQPFTSKLIMSNLKMFKYEWIWEKGKASNFLNVKEQPLKIHENIIIFSKDNFYRPQKQEISENARKRLKRSFKGSKFNGKDTSIGNVNNLKVPIYENGIGYPKSIIKFNRETNNQYKTQLFHPTQKPVALFEYLIKTYSNKGDLVMDCVVGSGTTAVACKNLNRNFICNDNNLDYVKIANERLNQFALEKSKGTGGKE